MASSHSYWLYISYLKEVDVCLFVCLFPECIYTSCCFVQQWQKMKFLLGADR